MNNYYESLKVEEKKSRLELQTARERDRKEYDSFCQMALCVCTFQIQ